MIIYETTCLVNGKKYIGMDTHNDPNYYGSGILISRAINKHGKENFVKKVIEECDTIEELKEREIYWVDYFNAQKSNEYYNIMPGGLGGDYLTYHPEREEIIKKFSGDNNGMRKMSLEDMERFRKKMSEVTSGENNGMFNRKHKEESKQLQREKAVGRFTLNWFIERNGKEEGERKYKERNKKLSEDRMGEKNPFKGFEYEKHPMYTDINPDKLLSLIKQGLGGVLLARHFNTTTTTIYAKIKRYWGCKIWEIRERK